MATDAFNLTVEWELICEHGYFVCIYVIFKADDGKILGEGIALVE